MSRIDKCPNCGKGTIIIDHESGEYVCNRCGYVVPGRVAYAGPEWRAFTKEERMNRRRTGPPASLTRVGRGLPTVIGKTPRDVHGRRLGAAARQRFQRMRMWDTRSKLRTPRQRNLIRAMSLLTRISDKLRLSGAVEEEAAYIYRKALDKKLIKGRTISGMVAASVYAACRNHRVPRTLGDIKKASNVQAKMITRFYRALLRSLDITVPVMDPARRVSAIANQVGLKEKTQRIALGILDKAKQRGIVVGKNPMSLAAAALYVASLTEGDRITQDELASAAGISAVTLRSRYADLRKLV